MSKKTKKKIVLAYSGGLDTSIIVPWLKENHDCEVHAYCGDIGQGDDELRGLELLALAQVGREGDDLGAVGLLQPFQNNRRVEAARVGEHDFLDLFLAAGLGHYETLFGRLHPLPAMPGQARHCRFAIGSIMYRQYARETN